MALTPQTIDFLSENRLNNSKEWYDAHKKDYERLVRDPMLAISAEIGPAMLEIDPLLVTQPGKTISRVRRDTRFTHDKSLYRDVMWITFHRGKGMAAPTFFFEFSPHCYRYGCGYYQTPPVVKQQAAEMILKGDKLFLAARAAIEDMDNMPLLGDFYKRKRYPDAPPELSDWLERKNLDACHEGKSPEILFSENLGPFLADKFTQLAPFYHFLLEAHTRSGESLSRE